MVDQNNVTQAPGRGSRIATAALAHSRTVYWFLLAGGLGMLVLIRINSIWDGQVSSLDKGVLLVLAVVLLAPLVTEFEGFGFKLKSELGALRTDIQRELTNLQLTLSASVATTQNISIRTEPVSEEVLERLLRQLPPAPLHRTRGEPESALIPSELPHEVLQMFAIRWGLEREVIRIARERDLPDPVGGSLFSVITGLARAGVLPGSADHAFREIYKLTSRAIHGLSLTPDQVEFVEEAAPKVLAALRDVRTTTSR